MESGKWKVESGKWKIVIDPLSPYPAPLAEEVVGQNEGGHGFDDGHSPGQHASVMAATAEQFGILAVGGDGLLRAHDGGGGLKGDAEEDIFAVGDAALDTAGMVGRGAHPAVLHPERIIVLATGELGTRKARTDFKPLGRWQREHRLGQIGFQFVKNRFAQAGWATSDDAFDDAADRVAVGPHCLDECDHRLDHRRIAGADDIRFHGHRSDGGWIDTGLKMLDGFHPSDNLDAGVKNVQHLARHGCGGDPANRLTGRCPATARRCADAKLRVVRKIGVAGPVAGGHFVVGGRSLVGIAHQNGDRGAEGQPIVDAGKNLGAVFALWKCTKNPA